MWNFFFYINSWRFDCVSMILLCRYFYSELVWFLVPDNFIPPVKAAKSLRYLFEFIFFIPKKAQWTFFLTGSRKSRVFFASVFWTDFREKIRDSIRLFISPIRHIVSSSGFPCQHYQLQAFFCFFFLSFIYQVD